MAAGGLLGDVRRRLRAGHYSPRTERAYVHWVRRFVRFAGLRHPGELGEAEVTAFLTDLAVRGRVSAATQNQALAALLYLYREYWGTPWAGSTAWCGRAGRCGCRRCSRPPR